MAFVGSAFGTAAERRYSSVVSLLAVHAKNVQLSGCPSSAAAPQAPHQPFTWPAELWPRSVADAEAQELQSFGDGLGSPSVLSWTADIDSQQTPECCRAGWSGRGAIVWLTS